MRHLPLIHSCPTLWVRATLLFSASTVLMDCPVHAQDIQVSRETTFVFALPQQPDTAHVEVFIPPRTHRVRTVVVFIARSVEQYAFDDRDWRVWCARLECALARIALPGAGTPTYESTLIRDAAAGGGEAVLRSLRTAAQLTGHSELASVGIVMFGHSAAGSFVVTFASAHPERVVGVVRYHSVPLTTAIDTGVLARIPMLSIVGARDAVVGEGDSRALWRSLRVRGAPAAYVSHQGQSHASIDGLVEAGVLVRDWIAGLMAGTGAITTAPFTTPRPANSAGWLVQDSTGRLTAGGPGTRDDSSWLPDLNTALELKRLGGACAAVSLREATDLLGASTHLVSESIYNCRYATDAPSQRSVTFAITRAADTTAAWTLARRLNGMRLVAQWGDMYFSQFPLRDQRCSLVTTAVSVYVYTATLCGEGFGTEADSAALKPLIQRLLGSD